MRYVIQNSSPSPKYRCGHPAGHPKLLQLETPLGLLCSQWRNEEFEGPGQNIQMDPLFSFPCPSPYQGLPLKFSCLCTVLQNWGNSQNGVDRIATPNELEFSLW